MRNFKVGDKVKYVGNSDGRAFTPGLIGLCGTITNLSCSLDVKLIPYKLGPKSKLYATIGKEGDYFDHNLKLVEPLTYERAIEILNAKTGR